MMDIAPLAMAVVKVWPMERDAIPALVAGLN